MAVSYTLLAISHTLMTFKSDFPLLQNNPDCIYLDNAATVQKPQQVIDAVNNFILNDYANVHRGVYDLSQRAEEVFWNARKTVANRHECRSDEVVFTPWTTIGINMLTSSLQRSWWVDAESVIVLSQWEHHANIVPWQVLSKQTWATIKWIPVDEYGIIDYDSLQRIVNEWWVTLMAVQSCSNVTWAIHDLVRVRAILWDETMLVVDASQSVAHYALPSEVSPDFLFWTWHKIGAYTGCGVMIGKKEYLTRLQPWRGWGGAIERVTKQHHTYQWSPDKFEPGTPNLIGAVSIATALEYLWSIGWYDMIHAYETNLVDYCLEQLLLIENSSDLKLLWPRNSDQRIGVFWFMSETRNLHQLGQQLAQEWICVRTWGQCAHPLHESLWSDGSLRMSLRFMNTIEECEKFFEVLNKLLS